MDDYYKEAAIVKNRSNGPIKYHQMKVAVKYLILLVGFACAYCSFCCEHIGAGISAAGAFIAFALLEINDLKIINDKED